MIPSIFTPPNWLLGKRHGKLFDELDLSGLDSWPPELAEGHLPFIGRAPQCVFVRSNRVRLYSFLLSIQSEWPMILPLRNDLDGFPCPWSRRFKTICGRCWNLVLSGLARVHGTMLWCWSGRRMEACNSVSTSNACTKKDSYPLPRIQEAESLVGAGHFSLQIKMEEVSKPNTAFTLGNLGFLECNRIPFRLCNVLAMFQRLMQNCLGQTKPHLLSHLPRWHNHVFADHRRTPPSAMCGVWPILGV